MLGLCYIFVAQAFCQRLYDCDSACTNNTCAQDTYRCDRVNIFNRAPSSFTHHNKHSPFRIKAAIDNKTPSDMRAIILTVTDTNGKITNKNDEKIAAFARAVDPVATCATVDTAGGHGMDTCAEECERTFFFEAQDSRKASCHVLCTLATAPCAKG